MEGFAFVVEQYIGEAPERWKEEKILDFGIGNWLVIEAGISPEPYKNSSFLLHVFTGIKGRARAFIV